MSATVRSSPAMARLRYSGRWQSRRLRRARCDQGLRASQDRSSCGGDGPPLGQVQGRLDSAPKFNLNLQGAPNGNRCSHIGLAYAICGAIAPYASWFTVFGRQRPEVRILSPRPSNLRELVLLRHGPEVQKNLAEFLLAALARSVLFCVLFAVMPNRLPPADLLATLAAEMWEERGEGAWSPADTLQAGAYLAFAKLTVEAAARPAPPDRRSPSWLEPLRPRRSGEQRGAPQHR